MLAELEGHIVQLEEEIATAEEKAREAHTVTKTLKRKIRGFEYAVTEGEQMRDLEKAMEEEKRLATQTLARLRREGRKTIAYFLRDNDDSSHDDSSAEEDLPEENPAHPKRRATNTKRRSTPATGESGRGRIPSPMMDGDDGDSSD